MRVLFVSSGNAKDGISPIIQNQGESLITEGINVNFFTIKGKGLISYMKHISILRTYLKHNEFTIIHAHYGFCGIVSLLAKRKEKIVVSFMGSDILGDVNIDGSITLLSKIYISINKLCAKYFFDFTIVKSQNLKGALYNKTVAEIIPNGVDFLQFYPIDKKEARKKLNISLNQKIILFAANPERKEKNYKLADDAIKILSDTNVALKIVFNVSQKILNEYYNASDVILMTSFLEGSPNVIKEALASNRVIVSTDVGDAKNNMENVDGCFICSYNPGDVAQKIKEALKMENSTGREHINYLDSKIIAKKIIHIYNQLLS